MTPEVKVKEQIKALARKHGALIRTSVMTGYGAHSQADHTLCVNGMYLAVEAKATDKSRITWLQLKELEDVLDHDGVAAIVHAGNLDQLDQLLHDLCQPNFNSKSSPSAMNFTSEIRQRIASTQPATQHGARLSTRRGN